MRRGIISFEELESACCVLFVVNNAGVEMEVIDSCVNGNGGCEQVCRQADSETTTCSCHDGFTLRSDRKSCQGSERYLPFAFGLNIRRAVEIKD